MGSQQAPRSVSHGWKEPVLDDRPSEILCHTEVPPASPCRAALGVTACSCLLTAAHPHRLTQGAFSGLCVATLLLSAVQDGQQIAAVLRGVYF